MKYDFWEEWFPKEFNQIYVWESGWIWLKLSAGVKASISDEIFTSLKLSKCKFDKMQKHGGKSGSLVRSHLMNQGEDCKNAGNV